MAAPDYANTRIYPLASLGASTDAIVGSRQKHLQSGCWNGGLANQRAERTRRAAESFAKPAIAALAVILRQRALASATASAPAGKRS